MTYLEQQLNKARAAGEGVLSISMATNGMRDYADMEHRARYLLDCGMNQLLIISYVPEVKRLAPLAGAEQVEVIRNGRGVSQEASFDTVEHMRGAFPELPVIMTPMVGDMLAYGMQRYVNRAAELGVSGWDSAFYQAIPDPIGLRRMVQERNMGFICAVFSNMLDLNNAEDRKTIRELVAASSGEMFVVPAVPGSSNGLKGEYVKPMVDYIREVQEELNHRIPLIGIGGIASADDAYEMVRVAGVDGIHFSSAYMKRLHAGMPEEEIIAWLKTVKAAMRG